MPELDDWRRPWLALGAVPSDATFRALVERYGEPHRRYHTLRHLDECLAQLDELREVADAPDAVAIALWFHDAVYDPKRSDNEAQSADWARSEALAAGLAPPLAERIHALVLATRHDAVPDSCDARVLVDIDLSILAAEPERFDEYERQVRAEYAWVPRFLFRRKRRQILAQLLARPALFGTERFARAYEARARANLARSLRALGG